MEGTKEIKSTLFHQYSWNSEVETTWISLIGWHHKTSNGKVSYIWCHIHLIMRIWICMYSFKREDTPLCRISAYLWWQFCPQRYLRDFFDVCSLAVCPFEKNIMYGRLKISAMTLVWSMSQVKKGWPT